MTDHLRHALADAVAAETPDTAPPFALVLDRHGRRQRRTRGLVAVGTVAAAAAVIAVVATRGGPGEDRTAPPVATDATVNPSGTALTPHPATGDIPPVLVLGGAEGPVDAQQGSFCWGNGCGDHAIPSPAALPDVGFPSPLPAAFPLPGQWSITLSEAPDGTRCASYPVLVEPDSETHLQLTPSGPAVDRFAGYFVYAGSGDTSGYWRWTVTRDGVPLSWMTITQNTPSSGGMADLELVLDDAAVDGAVSAGVTVKSANGAVETFALSEVDQHCADDGFVELAVPSDTPERRIDGLGPAPYAYTVDLTIDGETYTGTGTWSGEGTQHGGDARLTFEPALPTLE
ncbi:hypothetical protein [Nocardioides antri]|uniref:Uncharacterized protein n=1 Tax=Nocardioides antri TaxID=2607659 RepID=A0A5B1MCE5_9ACTN|nr:hypothetical protein [Nocardioides antri]KAA1429270.1 hypothetical protein F0U47_03515 [Nocardioides antri]